MSYSRVRVGDICAVNKSSYSQKEKWKYVNYLDTGNITNNRIDEIQYIDLITEKLPSRAKRKVKHNSIIISTVRPNQLHYGIIKSQPENFLVSTGFAVIDVMDDTLDADYLYYVLTQKEIVAHLHAIAEQSTSAYPAIKPSDIQDLEILIPDLKTQKKIASLLISIDSRISINTKINENLEQQAQAIFKSWFVDFEPFGGYIPSNWTQTTLGNVCVCELGGTPSRAKSEYWNGSIPWINSGEINNFRIIKPSETITDLGLNKSATKLLPSKTTVIAITGATLGQVSLLEIASCANQSVVGVVPNERIPYEFIYPYIKAHIQELISHQTGGAQQHINKQNVESLPIIVPTEDSFKKYVDFVGGLYFAIANNCFENERLAELRDSLLPKLMNGEIDVSAVKI